MPLVYVYSNCTLQSRYRVSCWPEASLQIICMTLAPPKHFSSTFSTALIFGSEIDEVFYRLRHHLSQYMLCTVYKAVQTFNAKTESIKKKNPKWMPVTHLRMLCPGIGQSIFAKRDIVLLKGWCHGHALVLGPVKEEETFFLHGATMKTHSCLQLKICFENKWKIKQTDLTGLLCYAMLCYMLTYIIYKRFLIFIFSLNIEVIKYILNIWTININYIYL